MTESTSDHWREYLMEAGGLGIFMISACIFTTAIEHPGSPIRQWITSAFIRRIIVGIGMGLTAIGLIYSPWGKQSGAHLNPSVTITFFRLGKLTRSDAFFYVLAQFVGAGTGVLVSAFLLGQWISHPAVNYAVTVPGPKGESVAFAAELFISFVLMTMILVVSNGTRFPALTGVLSGILVATYISLEAPLSGMSMNPARTFGSGLSSHMWKGWWIYFTAPPIGMLLAAEFYRRLRGVNGVVCAKLHHQSDKRCIFRCGYRQMITPRLQARSCSGARTKRASRRIRQNGSVRKPVFDEGRKMTNLLKRLAGWIALLFVVTTVTSRAQVTEKKALTLEGAKKVIAAAETYAKQNNAPGGVIAVVDDGGNLMALERLDGTFAAGANISIGKARTAVMFKKPSKVFEDLINKGCTTMVALKDFTPLQGGVPSVVGGQIVGGVGVSGALSAQQDEELAIAGAQAAAEFTTTSAVQAPTTTVLADRYEGRRLNSPNDLVYRSDGALYFTDPPFGLPKFFDHPRKEMPYSGVFCLINGRLKLVSTDLGGPNGLAFSPDEKYLCVDNWDLKKKTIIRYEVQRDGTLLNGKVFFDATDEPGEDAWDGMKVDQLGNLYLSGPGGLWIVSPAGKHLGTIIGPEHPHNMAWGDEDGKTLYLCANRSLSNSFQPARHSPVWRA